MARPFLTARWLDLILANYAVPDDLLTPRLPPGLELDRFGGAAFVSLVAFRFVDTRVWGIRWPLHIRFNEANLRFYVREPDGTRGVFFVREYVPQLMTVLIARLAYNEPYARARIDAETSTKDDHRQVRYNIHEGGLHGIAVEARAETACLGPDSAAHFFKEHEFGYGVGHNGKALRYRVDHPAWDTHEVTRADISVDWQKLYGADWSFLNDREPDSVFLAVGSEVTVSKPDHLTVLKRQSDSTKAITSAGSGRVL